MAKAPLRLILTEIRLPRTLLAALTGAALALSGAALQGYLRNPLAEPGIIGVSSGAGLGAVLAIHSGASAAFALALPLGGLAGAAVATLVVLALGRRARRRADADPRRRRRVERGDGADLAGAEPVAESRLRRWRSCSGCWVRSPIAA